MKVERERDKERGYGRVVERVAGRDTLAPRRQLVQIVHPSGICPFINVVDGKLKQHDIMKSESEPRVHKEYFDILHLICKPIACRDILQKLFVIFNLKY